MARENKYSVYELYFRRDGEKMSVLCNTIREVGRRRRMLKKSKRKFLGYRPITLQEVR